MSDSSVMVRNSRVSRVFGVWGQTLVLALGGVLILLSQTARADEKAPSPVAVDWADARAVLHPGGTSKLSVRFSPAPGWHLYWKNPGDSGLPVKIEWKLPSGIEAVGDLEFPRPTLQSQGKLVNFGYSEPFAVRQAFRVASGLDGKSIEVAARLRWLVCQESCIPGKAELKGEFRVVGGAHSTAGSLPGNSDGSFDAKKARYPVELPVGVSFRVEQTQKDWVLTVEPYSVLKKALASSGATLARVPSGVFFFPEVPGLVEHSGEQRFSLKGDSLQGVVPRAISVESLNVERFAGVLALGPSSADPAVNLTRRVEGGRTQGETKAETPRFWLSVLGAFLGGILLNLMPCVFPVLWLKILALLQAREKSSRSALWGALIYSAGILVSFWVLAGALIALRAGGEKLGWGFQLQAPGFVASMVLLMVLISLNLWGVFEVSLGRWTGIGSGLAARKSALGAFFTGVLATVVATPCTAPFMGASIGYALTQPPLIGLTVFTALGVGLAFPFVLFALVPSLGLLLPKPGAWMETLRKFMAVPILGTAVWLAWVLGLQTGMPGLLGVGVGVLGIGGGALLLGRERGSIAALMLVSAFAGTVIFESWLLPVRSGVSREAGRAGAGLLWETWSPEQVQRIRAEGHSVLIDFTAAWCVTCQVNEQVAFSDPSVQARLLSLRATLLKADWTQSDPRITDALGSFGRTGVPLYVYYPSGGREAKIWPQILTPSIVLDALDEAEKAPQAAESSSSSKP